MVKEKGIIRATMPSLHRKMLNSMPSLKTPKNESEAVDQASFFLRAAALTLAATALSEKSANRELLRLSDRVAAFRDDLPRLLELEYTHADPKHGESETMRQRA